MKEVVEICCGSYYDAKEAFLGGASRIELNSALHLGGLTPSLAALKLTKKQTDLKVITMIRPRGAGFHYLEEDFEAMLLDCRLMMEHGSDGAAFGCLHGDRTIDVEKTKQLIGIVKEFKGEAVFHRAFDCVRDPLESLETIISLGFDRLLTSGLEAKAVDGIALITQLQLKYGDKIEILAGSGINASNARSVMDKTLIYQVHSSCKDWLADETTTGNRVSYAYADQELTKCYDVVSKELVEKLIHSIMREHEKE